MDLHFLILAESTEGLPVKLTAYAAMATAISVLWARFVASHKEAIRRNEEYEKNKTATNEKQVQMAGEIGELRGRQDGIELLSKQVLETVAEAVENRNERSSKTT